MRFLISDDEGNVAQVQALDWTMAMVRFIETRGIEVSGWVCENQPDGAVRVHDVGTNASWLIQSLDAPESPAPAAPPPGPPPVPPSFHPKIIGLDSQDRAPRSVRPASSPPRLPEAPTPAPLGPPSAFPSPAVLPEVTQSGAPGQAPEAPRKKTVDSFEGTLPKVVQDKDGARSQNSGAVDPEAPRRLGRAPSQALVKPRRRKYRTKVRRSLWVPGSTHDDTEPREDRDVAPANLDRQLAALAGMLGGRTANQACQLALEQAMALVPCEAGSIVRGGANDPALKFVACAGPAAEQMLGQELAFGEGLLGVAFDLGITVVNNDVYADPRFERRFDQRTGFRTRTVLCAAVRGNNAFYGALQLINPRGDRFQPWQVTAAEAVAQALSEVLSGHVR